MEYPKYIEVEDQRFELDTDYRTALKCFEVIEDPDIDDVERSLAVIVLLLNDIPQVDLNKVMELLMRYLSCGKSKVQLQVYRKIWIYRPMRTTSLHRLPLTTRLIFRLLNLCTGGILSHCWMAYPGIAY